jgi:hypothetical protein
MKRMIIYEPAMCCSTGVCGPSVDPELLRMATVLNNLKKRGILVERYNLSGNPSAFLNNQKISSLIKNGPESLPAVVLDGEIVKTKGYPTNEEFAKWLEIPADFIASSTQSKGCGCNCGPNGCC